MCHLPRTAWQKVCTRPAGSILHLVAMDEHHARGADRGRQRAAIDDAVAHRAGRAIAGPAHHDAIGRQPQLLGRCRRQFAGDFFRFVAVGQQAAVEFQLAKQFVDQSRLADVQQQHAAGVADFGGKLAGQPAADVVLGQQHLRSFGEGPRLVIAQPENLGGGEAGQGGIGHHADQLRTGRPSSVSISSHSAAVRWSFQSRARRITLVVFVEKHGAVHLARQPDRLDVGRLQLGLLDDGAHRSDRRPPPIVGILLAPQRLGMIGRIRVDGLA